MFNRWPHPPVKDKRTARFPEDAHDADYKISDAKLDGILGPYRPNRISKCRSGCGRRIYWGSGYRCFTHSRGAISVPGTNGAKVYLPIRYSIEIENRDKNEDRDDNDDDDDENNPNINGRVLPLSVFRYQMLFMFFCCSTRFRRCFVYWDFNTFLYWVNLPIPEKAKIYPQGENICDQTVRFRSCIWNHYSPPLITPQWKIPDFFKEWFEESVSTDDSSVVVEITWSEPLPPPPPPPSVRYRNPQSFTESVPDWMQRRLQSD
jgi:hypothetical protein